MMREVYLFVAIATAVLVVGVAAQSHQCGECDKSLCPPKEDCPGAETIDACNCCNVCRRSLGQRCDYQPTLGVTYGPCSHMLRCTPRMDISRSNEATCECIHNEEMCGSDGRTYPTSCDLLEEAKTISNLTVVRHGPCLMKPIIKTPPASSKRSLGGILVLDCEAVGVPTPSITWELFKDNGVSVKLPNDDSEIAVQIRGGPENHMVTGWVQIMKVTKDNVGTFVCKAENKEGEAMATAKITYFERENELL